MSCNFIGYTEKLKGHQFYCSTGHTRVLEPIIVFFFENTEISESTHIKEVNEQEQIVPVPIIN